MRPEASTATVSWLPTSYTWSKRFPGLHSLLVSPGSGRDRPASETPALLKGPRRFRPELAAPPLSSKHPPRCVPAEGGLALCHEGNRPRGAGPDDCKGDQTPLQHDALLAADEQAEAWLAPPGGVRIGTNGVASGRPRGLAQCAERSDGRQQPTDGCGAIALPPAPPCAGHPCGDVPIIRGGSGQRERSPRPSTETDAAGIAARCAKQSSRRAHDTAGDNCCRPTGITRRGRDL
jgi:hypothetical protein